MPDQSAVGQRLVFRVAQVLGVPVWRIDELTVAEFRLLVTRLGRALRTDDA